MSKFKVSQKFPFKAEPVFNLRPLEKYEILFSFLDLSPVEVLYPATSRPALPYEALLKALVYKNIKNVSYLSDLVRELKACWYLISNIKELRASSSDWLKVSLKMRSPK